MGLQFQTTSGRHYFEVFTIMKAFAALLPALLASTKAEAEADPYWTPAVYTASGLVAHANGALVPDYTPAQKAAAAAHLGAKANEYAVKGYGLYHPYAYGLPYAGYAGYPYTHGLWKRDAEAEAEADPYWTPAVYTPAQKAAAAAHLTAKASEYAHKYAYAYPYHAAYAHHPYAAYNPYGYLW